MSEDGTTGGPVSEDGTPGGVVSELIAAGALLVAQGFVQASGGNLSARLGADRMLISAAGTWLDRLRPADFVEATLDGAHAGPVAPSSEWLLHARVYRARPDVAAVVHLHPQHALLLDAVGRPIRFLTQDHAWYVGRYGRVPYLAAGGQPLADAVAAELPPGVNVCLMAHHGVAAVGESVAWALRRALNFEEAAIMTYRALTLGDEHAAFPGDPADAEHR